MITLHFTEFSTQPGKDVVRVLQCKDIWCTEHQQLAELSGMYSSIQTVTSSTGYVKVLFTSDSSVNFDGFAATWSMVSEKYCCSQLYTMLLQACATQTLLSFLCSGKPASRAQGAGPRVGCSLLQTALFLMVQAFQGIRKTQTANGE